MHAERQSATDLAVTGRLAGVAAGEMRFIRWAELAQLPTTKLNITGEFVPGPQEVTVVFLTDLWRALPLAAEADVLLATCNDGYASVYRTAFMRDYRPFLVLAINGLGPEKWPPPGLAYNPGPYVISVSADVAPAVAGLLDAGHKRPWGVVTIEAANYAERFSGFAQGRFSGLPPSAAAGREIWINSCASCHQGPANTFGGTKSDRPFALLATHAAHNFAFFQAYVRHPTSVVPTAKMEPHPHYTDGQLEALAAFVARGLAP